MADKLRRQKDVIKSSLSKYLESTTTGKYLSYFEGSPTYITYYQLDSEASLNDVGLENVNSLVGKNTPNKYKRIYEVPVYGVDALDVANELSERGLEANVNGELLFLPNSVRPYAGDFFTFEYDGLESHLFRINDVQYDKISPKKYFRCQFSLYPDNVANIFDNVADDYECQFDDSSNINIVKQSESAEKLKSQNLIDGLIDKYKTLFYDEETDTFIFKNISNGFCYWSPYIQHFLYETKALSKYNEEIMTEIYINDVNEVDNPEIYNEMAYRNSLFRNVQIQNPDLSFDSNFFCVPNYDLKCTRNLPFFMSNLKFKLISPVVKLNENDPSAYINTFPLFFKNECELFGNVDHYHKVHIFDELHLTRIEPYIKNKDIVYECKRHELEPTQMYMAIERENGEYINLEFEDISLPSLFSRDSLPDDLPIKNKELFEIIKDYLNGSFILTEEKTNKLNNLYYKPSLENYILLPMIIYILKESIK